MRGLLLRERVPAPGRCSSQSRGRLGTGCYSAIHPRQGQYRGGVARSLCSIFTFCVLNRVCVRLVETRVRRCSFAILSGNNELNKPARKLSRSFREVFAKFSYHFGRLCKLFCNFLTCSDLFGNVRMRSDAFGCVWMRSDASGNFQKISENSVKKINFPQFWRGF